MERFNYAVCLLPPYDGAIGGEYDETANYMAMVQREIQSRCNQGFDLVAVWSQPNGWALFVFRDKGDPNSR